MNSPLSLEQSIVNVEYVCLDNSLKFRISTNQDIKEAKIHYERFNRALSYSVIDFSSKPAEYLINQKYEHQFFSEVFNLHLNDSFRAQDLEIRFQNDVEKSFEMIPDGAINFSKSLVKLAINTISLLRYHRTHKKSLLECIDESQRISSGYARVNQLVEFGESFFDTLNKEFFKESGEVGNLIEEIKDSQKDIIYKTRRLSETYDNLKKEFQRQYDFLFA